MIASDPNPTAVAWGILAESAPAPRRRCPHCAEMIEHLDQAHGPEGWCAVCWFVDGPYEVAS